ncbi:MAG: hypothetical protein BGO98_22735 [Myxococcales bacterium 68-20]|nr:MAG: hypothetical protein BGO98_22735 [Myxococcales bacterium 68-20]
MIAPEHAKHGALAPTAHRPSARSPSPPTGSPLSTFETASSLAPVAMLSSPARAPRYAADPTMQLRPQRRSPALAVGLGLVAALFAGVAAGGIAIGPDALARGPAALYERLRGHVQADDANVATTASPVMPVSSPAEPPVASHPFAVSTETPASVPVSVAPQASASPRALPPHASSSSQPVPVVAIDALPKSNVEPNMTLVTLPRSAKGHRIFVDGRVVGNGAGPLKVACGTRKIKIGSGGKLQVRDLPCGGELALD